MVFQQKSQEYSRIYMLLNKKNLILKNLVHKKKKTFRKTTVIFIALSGCTFLNADKQYVSRTYNISNSQREKRKENIII